MKLPAAFTQKDLQAHPARQTNSIHIFLAEDLSHSTSQNLDKSEDISWAFLSSEAVQKAITDGEFSQALHVASLYLAQQFLSKRTKE